MPKFNCFPLVSMCLSRALNIKINRVHDQALRIIYNDRRSSFKSLLAKEHPVTVHKKVAIPCS